MSDVPAPTEVKASTQVNPYLSVALMAVLGISTVYSYNQVFTLQTQNRSLSNEADALRASMQTFQDENTQLTERITAVEKQKANLEAAVEGFKRETDSYKLEIEKINGSLGGIKEEKSYLEEMLINKNKEIQAIQQQAGSQPAGAEAAAGDAAQALAQKNEEIRKLTESNRILSEKLERIYKTTNEKISQINVAKMTLEETIAEARKIIENEWSTVNLGAITVDPKAGASEARKSEARKSAKREGRVLAVNEEHGFVVVDLGKVDNIKNDTHIALKKDGKELAKLSVLEIRDVMTACNIKDIQQGTRIQVNDPVFVS